jgi:hypothetical protein
MRKQLCAEIDLERCMATSFRANDEEFDLTTRATHADPKYPGHPYHRLTLIWHLLRPQIFCYFSIVQPSTQTREAEH